MSKTILANVDGWTPVIDTIVEDLDLMSAVVFGRIWRFCQMPDGVCKASLEKISSEIGMDRATVMRHAKELCKAGYLKDLTPDLRNRPHVYIDTGKASLELNLIVAQRNTEKKIVAESESTLQKTTPTVAESHLNKDSKKENKKLIDPRWDFNFKGDYTQYPPDVWEMLIEFCLLWNFSAPAFSKKSKEGSRAVMWLNALRELQEVCAEFGVEALKDYRKHFERYMQENGGLAPFEVSSPKSLVNVLAGHVARMRNGENKTSGPAIDQSSIEATRRLLAERDAIKAVPPPKQIQSILKGMQS